MVNAADAHRDQSETILVLRILLAHRFMGDY